MVDTPGRITLWGIEVFLATAEEGSVSAAARRLNASASAVSQQLTNLEAALGSTLLDRSSRPVVATPAGTLFRRRAQAILNEAAQAQAELAMNDMARLTRFRLGVIEDFDADVTPRLLADMASELKDAQFLLETGASHRLFDLLEDRTLDVIIASELGASADWMEVHPLLTEPFVVAAKKGAINPANPVLPQLTRLPFIQYTSRHYMGRLVEAHLMRQNIRPGHRFELDSYHAIMAMVSEGAGWTILTPLGFMRAQRFRDAADVLPLPFPPLSRTVMLTARREVLQDMPERLATRMRPLLQEMIVAPCVARMPWLKGDMRVL